MKSEQELLAQFPDIRWKSPLPLMFGVEKCKPRLMYACRFCIAQEQLGPNDLFRVSWHDREAWFRHQMTTHRLEKSEAAA